MNDEVCWVPVVGGCFAPAVSHFMNRKNQQQSVCVVHELEYFDKPGWEVVEK